MKILAVIPARAGSKGVPNKNIRMVNGKPLVAYVIENAMNSKYITDIIITTDSPEVELVANCYGVRYIHRSAELCEDSVTLDSVIYDACKHFDADYVITMQPTSPTLRTDTLDTAIEKIINKDLDTLISVVNRPHLAWVEREGMIVPDYIERLNRQYLPKRYLETGAFVISKYGIVTNSSRIGKKVDVFEISENEAIDIDSFQDLLCVEHILKKNKAAIVVNGNSQIGMGHICRMLEVADSLYYKPDIYYDSNLTDKCSFGTTTYQLIAYRNQEELVEYIHDGGYQIVLNDILDTDEKYISKIKKRNSNIKIVNFEDLGTGKEKADLVINALYYEENAKTNILFGEKFYIAPKMFLLYKPIEIRENVETVFICFGGADPQNYTDKLLHTISEKEYKKINFIVVLGKAKKNYKELIEKYTKENIEIVYDVKNMPEVMTKCDMAITSRGRTCYELALLGIPTIAMAQNEREEKHSFVCKENGFTYLGRDVNRDCVKEALDNMLISSQEERFALQKCMLCHDLRKGRERIKNLLDSI